MPRPVAFPVKKVIGFEQETLAALEEFRRVQTPIPNQSEAIRHIVKDWLINHGYWVEQSK